jgi:hypothetical protein
MSLHTEAEKQILGECLMRSINGPWQLDYSSSGLIADLRTKARVGNIACLRGTINWWSSFSSKGSIALSDKAPEVSQGSLGFDFTTTFGPDNLVAERGKLHLPPRLPATYRWEISCGAVSTSFKSPISCHLGLAICRS